METGFVFVVDRFVCVITEPMREKKNNNENKHVAVVAAAAADSGESRAKEMIEMRV